MKIKVTLSEIFLLSFLNINVSSWFKFKNVRYNSNEKFYLMIGKCGKNPRKRFLIGKIKPGSEPSNINQCSHCGYKFMNEKKINTRRKQLSDWSII